MSNCRCVRELRRRSEQMRQEDAPTWAASLKRAADWLESLHNARKPKRKKAAKRDPAAGSLGGDGDRNLSSWEAADGPQVPGRR